ncbi:MAG: iron ABC transporter permease [Rhodocyclaceae bacterium]|nr:iron ABC transporter permease [Rhodocyclaceae bacterium]
MATLTSTLAAAWRGQPRDAALRPVLAVLWALVLLFVLYPLGQLVLHVVRDDNGWTGRILADALAHRITWIALRNSIVLAILVGAIGTAIGFAIALLAARSNIPRPLRLAIDSIILLPLVSPPFAVAISIILALGPRGLVSHSVFGVEGFVIYGWHGVLLAETLTYFPIAYLALKGVIANASVTIEDAAFSLGAARWHVFRTVTLPMTLPGLANSFLLLSAASLADFATPLVLASTQFPVLPTQAYLQITGMYDTEGGAALAFLLIFPALGVYLLQRYWIGERSYVSVSGKTASSGGLAKFSAGALALLWAVTLLVVTSVAVFYGIIVYASLVQALGANHSFTLGHYADALTQGWPAFRDTLIVAGITMPVGGAFAVILGYVLARYAFTGRRALEFASMLDYALPGTIVGIAFLITFSSPPLVLTGGAAILVICFVFRYSLVGTRTTIALLQQVDPAIEEASASLGAGPVSTFGRIVTPLILPALAAGMTVLFIRAMTAISATIFLVSLDWNLVTVKILDGITNVELGKASAYSVLVILIIFVVVALTGVVLRALTRGVRNPGMQLGG